MKKRKAGRLPNSLADAADQIQCAYGVLWRLYKNSETQNVNGIERVLPGEIERLRPLIGRRRGTRKAAARLAAAE